MAGVPQFGDLRAELAYRDRPAAFGLCEREGRIALVIVDKPGFAPWLDLPGGAIDPGESAAQAVVREFGEETGLRISAGEAFAHADQFFVNTDGEAFNNRATFMSVSWLGEAPALKIEDDHTLVWIDPHEAIERLRHDAHAWAVSAWLRRVVAPGRASR
ncbi:NUDIX domain-containing protein [Phenylobacterium sp.]|uniref:NUDIX domain-containing protein n=1 Tax=Phenylobacterium sp. TaxID=1871053 RepID=UPI002734A2CC|nr:NUDIX domain-containing protein [Phenylobacterium sp.]MDP3661086.1 NUDIX domain-containing protein [Phenylobacterium sp.]